jgi:hypothetical protein
MVHDKLTNFYFKGKLNLRLEIERVFFLKNKFYNDFKI